MINAKEAKENAISSVSKELKSLEATISAASQNGQLKVEVDKISDAAKLHLTEQGFKVKISVKPSGGTFNSDGWVVIWE